MAARHGGIGVVGAGPAGLAAAWWLASRGRRVTVYEAREEVGGRLRTEELAGTAADAAVQLVSAGYDRLLEIAGDLGAAGLLVGVPGRDALWRRGRAHPVRYGSMASMAASAALPASLKLRMGMRYVPFLERHARHLDLNEPARAAAAGLDDESIAEWGRREMGEDFVELLAYPLLASYYGLTPDETSAGLFHCLARAGMGVSVLGVRGGVRALAAAMEVGLARRGVTILTGHPVSHLEIGPEGVLLDAAGGAAEHEGVVVAVPPAEARRLLPRFGWLAGVRSRPGAAVVLALRGELRTGWFGLSIPGRELPGSSIAAVCVQAEKETGVVGPAGDTLVLVPAPEEAPGWSGAEAAAVVERTLADLGRVLPEAPARVVEARLVRLAGGFIPYPGYLARLTEYDEHTAELPSRVALAGDYLVAPTVEGAVRGGLAAAERINRATA